MQVKDLILEYLNQPYFKSAVAFFFLFFLHGTSIGNGQQGISYNGSGIDEGGALNHQS